MFLLPLCGSLKLASTLLPAGVGVVVENGPGASKFQPGQRVVGW